MELTVAHIKERVHNVRGSKVVLDRDLAEFYQTETRVLNQAVRRNSSRFPIDFVFKLNETEVQTIAYQVKMDKSDRGGRRYLPYGFTQEGISMLSGVLNSDVAIQVNILIMRAFIQLRQVTEDQLNLTSRLDRFESRCEEQFRRILENQRRTLIPISNSPLNSASGQFESCLATDENLTKLNLIHQTVAKYFGINVRSLKQNSRVPGIVLPRQVAIYLVRTHLGLTLNQIGKIYAKDHSTILAAYRKIASVRETNSIIRNAIGAIEEQLDLKQTDRSLVSIP